MLGASAWANYGHAGATRTTRTLFLRALARVPPISRILPWLLRQFAIYHIRAIVQELKRAYQRRIAIQPESVGEVDALSRVERFDESLPAVPWKRLLLAVVLFASALAFIIFRFGFHSNSYAHSMSALFVAVLSSDTKKINEAVLSFEPRDAIGAFFITIGSAWIALCLPLWAFRVEQVLFSRELSRREQALFGRLRVQPPRDPPVDLLGPTLLLTIPLWVAAVLASFAVLVQHIGAGQIRGLWLALPFYAAALALLALSVARGIALVRAVRYRTAPRADDEWRLSPPVTGTSRVGRVARRATALVAVVGILVAAVVGPPTSSARAHREIALTIIQVDSYAQFQTYASAVHLSGNFTPDELQSVGDIVVFHVHVQTPTSGTFRSHWSVHSEFEPQGGAVRCGSPEETLYSVERGLHFSVDAPSHQTAIDRSALFLVDIEQLKSALRGNTATFDGQSRVWVPTSKLPPDNPMFIEIDLLDTSGQVVARACSDAISPIVD